MHIITQINIRTARFLQKFIASENSLCLLFAANAACQLNELLSEIISLDAMLFVVSVALLSITANKYEYITYKMVRTVQTFDGNCL